jgi:quercetin 2,3-dioxygenase
MFTVRKAAERGRSQTDWLDSRHTFSFAEYFDPQYVGFHSLRVINEDRVQPAMGFGTHGHRDMEIVTYVLEGALAHKDSLGNGSVIRPGEVQRMSAGTGIMHSEFNDSKSELVHFLQIWIEPSTRGFPPGYEQRPYNRSDARGKLLLLASPQGQGGLVAIHQDARLYLAVLEQGGMVSATLRDGRSAWLQVVRGDVELNGARLQAGDGAAVSGERSVRIDSRDSGEVLLFDLP